MKTLDLNCDMGEGFGVYAMGDDEALLEFVNSSNIACGFHAGDPGTMARTVRAAAARGVAIGAHPGLADLQGFGRRAMAITPSEAYDLVVYQVGALQGVAAAAGARVRHVKTHGALDNMAVVDEKLSEAICRAVRDVDASLLFYAMSGSITARVARGLGLRVVSVVYADRSYQDDGTLTPRRQEGAMITDLRQSVAQVRDMLERGFVRARSGREVPIEAQALSLHGDQPGALAFASGLTQALRDGGVTLAAASPAALA